MSDIDFSYEGGCIGVTLASSVHAPLPLSTSVDISSRYIVGFDCESLLQKLRLCSVSELTQSLKSAQPRKDEVNAMKEGDKQRRSAQKVGMDRISCV